MKINFYYTDLEGWCNCSLTTLQAVSLDKEFSFC